VLEKALEQARRGRMHIMGEMLKVIPEPRADYKPFVPRIVQIRIAAEFIGAVIGKGGETIQKIQKETGTVINIDEEPIPGTNLTEGVVDIASDNAENMQKALEWIQGICAVPEVGKVYHGKVVSILEFGAFIEIMPGKEGLLHVSEIAWTKTEKVEDVLAVGDEVDVKLLEYDPKAGKMRLSMRALTEKPEGYVEPKPRMGNGPRRDGKDGGRREGKDGGNRGPRRDGRGPRRDNNK
jgi:polyribonucleotide nucleotidyltransferase